MSTTFSQNFSSFNFINERSCYFLEFTSKWDLNTNFSSIDGDHKKLSFSKGTDFKIETKTLNAWISLNTDPNDMKFLSHIYSFMIYMIPKL